MHEFEEVNCSYCDTPNFAVNLDGCLICETFSGACSECMTRHRGEHTEAETSAFKREMLETPEPTIREKINAELKAQIRRNAESMCKLLDDRESLIKSYEKQCGALANEVDRLRKAQ